MARARDKGVEDHRSDSMGPTTETKEVGEGEKEGEGRRVMRGGGEVEVEGEVEEGEEEGEGRRKGGEEEGEEEEDEVGDEEGEEEGEGRRRRMRSSRRGR